MVLYDTVSKRKWILLFIEKYLIKLAIVTILLIMLYLTKEIVL